MPPCFKILAQSINPFPFGYGEFVTLYSGCTGLLQRIRSEERQAREPVLVRIHFSG